MLNPKPVDANQLVSEFQGIIRKAVGESCRVKVWTREGLWLCHVDPARLETALLNLALNARDAMPNGGRLIIETHNVEIGDEYCRKHAYGAPGRYVLLSVSDTGTGMDAATLERIYEPFFTTKEAGRGTGLGLATVYGIVKQHDGFIYVYSEPGSGTSFRIYLRSEAGVHLLFVLFFAAEQEHNPLRHQRFRALMHGRLLRRLVKIWIRVDPFDVRRLPPKGCGHADDIHRHLVLAAEIDRRVERFDIVARFISEHDDHHVPPRRCESIVAELLGQKADRMKDVFLAVVVGVVGVLRT